MSAFPYLKLLFFGLCLLAGVGVSQHASAQSVQEELADPALRTAQALSKAGRLHVTVADFTDLDGNVTQLGRYLAEEFFVALAEQGSGLRLLDRANRERIMEEHKLKSEGLVEKSDVLRLGKFTAVQAIIVGKIVPMEDQYRLILRIVTTDTADTLGAIPGANLARTSELRSLEGQPLRSLPREVPPSSEKSFMDRSAIATDQSFRLSVVGYERTDQGDVMLYVLHQSLQERVSVALLKSETYVVDELGNQYLMRRAGNIPYLRDNFPVGEFEKKDFPAGIPVRYTVTFTDVLPTARSLSLVLTYALDGSRPQMNKTSVTVSDLGL